jgi:hypothetical protein
MIPVLIEMLRRARIHVDRKNGSHSGGSTRKAAGAADVAGQPALVAVAFATSD